MSRDTLQVLEIYLDDHWAGAAAGLALARRLRSHNRDTEWNPRLSGCVAEIEEDSRTLAQIRRDLGFEGGGLKRLAALAGERVSSLKPNGRIFTYSPLSRVLECEALQAGVSAKRSLWASLSEVYGSDPEMFGYDFDELVARADRQLELLGSFHAYAAEIAFR